MEKENNQPIYPPVNPNPASAVSEPQPSVDGVVPSVTQQVPVSPKVKLIDTWKEKFNNLPKNTKLLILVVSILFLIIFLLAILVALFGNNKSAPVIAPTPSPIAVTPAPQIILGASRYATDSGVLKIEENLNGFQKQLNSSDVKQTDLKEPTMDFNINFNKN